VKYRFIQWSEEPASQGSGEETIGVLTLNRPERKNALGPRMALELDNVFNEIRHSSVRVVVVTGAGGDFCSGGDLKEETLPLERPEDSLGLRGEYGELAQWMINDHFHFVAQRALRKLEELPQPVIASIDGAAVGAGFEMAIACDLRIASDRLRFSEIAVPAGFVSEWSCPRNLPKLVGLGLATELILTGRFVHAEEALAVGLVNRVVPAEKLKEETMKWAGQIAMLPRLGVRYAKELLKMYNQDNRSEERNMKELERVLEIVRGQDSSEGIRALLERRPPRWAGPRK
jgi:enoyl-CoA hydratase/carnithine racemase